MIAMKYPDGSMYVGEHLKASHHGVGQMVYPVKMTYYSGSWHHGLRNGFGGSVYPSSTYQGNWKDDKRHGHGKEVGFTGLDDWLYEGGFGDNERHGEGLLTHSAYGTFKGRFERGKFVEGTKVNPDCGDRATGTFVDGKLHGHGIYVHHGGRSLEGTWVHGVPAPLAEFTVLGPKEEGVYIGPLKDLLPHGHGTYTWSATGVMYRGEFVEGRLTEAGAYIRPPPPSPEHPTGPLGWFPSSVTLDPLFLGAAARGASVATDASMGWVSPPATAPVFLSPGSMQLLAPSASLGSPDSCDGRTLQPGPNEPAAGAAKRCLDVGGAPL